MSEEKKNLVLKSVAIHGFKSFAESTYIEFSDGVNIITDPYGQGAKDVLLAIDWVLGGNGTIAEQSAEKIIFDGNGTRDAITEAEVVLRIGSTENDGNDVAYKRQINANGENHYFVGGKEISSLAEWKALEKGAFTKRFDFSNSKAQFLDSEDFRKKYDGGQTIIVCNDKKLIAVLKPKRIIGIAQEEIGVSKVYNIEFA